MPGVRRGEALVIALGGSPETATLLVGWIEERGKFLWMGSLIPIPSPERAKRGCGVRSTTRTSSI